MKIGRHIWKPRLFLVRRSEVSRSLLEDPNYPNLGVFHDVAMRLYKEENEEYKMMAKEWTKMFVTDTDESVFFQDIEV